MDEIKITNKIIDDISQHNRDIDGRSDYLKGLRTERERITNLIKKDIEFQSSKLKHDFESDKAILWRIEGMKFLINKITGWGSL